MALVDTGRAIGATTRLLQDQLIRRGFEVSVGRPEAAARDNAIAKLNLFLYETEFDASLRNQPLRDAEPAPLWLVLKYLLTAFEGSDSSDSAEAHDLLGRGLAALQAIACLPLDSVDGAGDRQALEPNPEPLKLTLDAAPSELLSRVMQGSDERYRLSAAFQVRPVMVSPALAPRAALLVGVDYSQPLPADSPHGGLAIEVRATLGPRLSRVEPARFEQGALVDVVGTDLFGNELEVLLGSQMLPVLERTATRLRVRVEGPALVAGEWPLCVRRRLAADRTRSSNLLLPRLLPTLTAARWDGADLVLEGALLGRAEDDVVVSFYRAADGVTVSAFDSVEAVVDQTRLSVPGAATATPAGEHRVVLRVNNQQARSSPLLVVA